jgi:hypothetical protein
MKLDPTATLLISLFATLTGAFAQSEMIEQAAPAGDTAAEMARKLQDPLANISAIMTDNDISFNTGKGEPSYGFQIQPVKAFSFDDLGLNFIARAVIPIQGAAPDSQRPLFGPPIANSRSNIWGLSDINTQFFFSPKSDSAWKWGLGPTISWKTRTDERLAGPGWGAGPIGVLVGSLSENISTSFIGGHLWGQQDGFSTSFVQPMIFYNFQNAPGLVVGFNNTLAYDWNASSGNAWTVPLGFTIGKTFDIGGGNGLDLSIGPYWNIVKPEGAADFSLKFGLTWLMP